MENNRAKHFAAITMMSVLIVLIIAITGVSAASVPYGTGKVKPRDGAYLRKSASTSSEKVAVLKYNTDLIIKKIVFKKKSSTKAKYKWYKVSANGKSGYIRSDLVKKQTYTGVKAKVKKKVAYRTGAGIKQKRKGYLKKGKTVTVYLKARPVSSTKGSSSTWYMIKKGSKKYYACSASFKLLDTEPGPVGSKTPSAQAATPDPTPEAAGSLGNGSLSDKTVNKRINELINALNGKHFTTDGKPCYVSAADECRVTDVIKKNSDVIGLLNKYKGGSAPGQGYMPYHYDPYGNTLSGGYSCCGFANFAGWYIAADSINSNTHYDRINACINYDRDSMKKCAKAGDIVRSKTHSFIVVSVDEDGCNVLDSNWGNSCMVSAHKIKWSYYDVVTICRASDRE